MIKRITSVLLAVSFVILTVSGMTMLFSKELSHSLMMNPFHEVFAVLMTITGIIHLILNWKPLVSYFSRKYIKIIFSIIIGFIVMLYVIIIRFDKGVEELQLPSQEQYTGTDNQQPELNTIIK